MDYFETVRDVEGAGANFEAVNRPKHKFEAVAPEFAAKPDTESSSSQLMADNAGDIEGAPAPAPAPAAELAPPLLGLLGRGPTRSLGQRRRTRILSLRQRRRTREPRNKSRRNPKLSKPVCA